MTNKKKYLYKGKPSTGHTTTPVVVSEKTTKTLSFWDQQAQEKLI